MPQLPANPPIARVQLSLEGLPAAERLDLWREALEPVFEITPESNEPATPFSGSITATHLGAALLSEVRSGPQLFDRSRAHARRSGLDHFMVQTFRHGHHDGACGENTVHRREGDVWILDLGRDTKTQASHFANITLIIPRDRMLPLLGGTSLHGATLHRGSPSARLIASHLETLAAVAPQLTLGEAAAAVDAAAVMMASAWSSLREGRAEVGAAVRATARRAVRDHIDRHLMDDQLTPEALARLFRMSRATLYRLFDEEGGVAAYILGRRLDRCRAILAANLTGLTIGEIAFSHGFTSEAHFSRAFRRRFGMAPRDARGGGPGPALDSQGGAQADARTIADWLATFRRERARLAIE